MQGLDCIDPDNNQCVFFFEKRKNKYLQCESFEDVLCLYNIF